MKILDILFGGGQKGRGQDLAGLDAPQRIVPKEGLEEIGDLLGDRSVVFVVFNENFVQFNSANRVPNTFQFTLGVEIVTPDALA